MDQSIPNPAQTDVPFSTDAFHNMPYRRLGQSGLQVSNVGLGTWKFGYPETGDGARVDEKTAFQIFDRAIELGVTFWDTANRYNSGSGNSERVIGRWLKNNPDQRRNVVLATKVFGGMDGYTPNHCRSGRVNILESVYASIERLQCDNVDLLYFHFYDPITPVEESSVGHRRFGAARPDPPFRSLELYGRSITPLPISRARFHGALSRACRTKPVRHPQS